MGNCLTSTILKYQTNFKLPITKKPSTMTGTTARAPTIVISDTPSLALLLTDLKGMLIKSRQSTSEADKLKLFIDLEGHNLGREGTLSVMTVLIRPVDETVLIDIHTLGDLAFTTSLVPLVSSQLDAVGGTLSTNINPSPDLGKGEDTKATTPAAALTPSLDDDAKLDNDRKDLTLKSLLEDPSIPKYLWDVRNDADALFSHHNVRLSGVIDVQLFEVASRPGNRLRDKKYLRGLDSCIEKDLDLRPLELHQFLHIKREVRLMMDPANPENSRCGNHGGAGGGSRNHADIDIFARRPLPANLIEYCTGDVIHLTALYEVYSGRIKADWREKALEESAKRVEEACSPGFKSRGEEKKFGPSSWSSPAMTEEEYQSLVEASWKYLGR